jgi:hypothetical protein
VILPARAAGRHRTLTVVLTTPAPG